MAHTSEFPDICDTSMNRLADGTLDSVKPVFMELPEGCILTLQGGHRSLARVVAHFCNKVAEERGEADIPPAGVGQEMLAGMDDPTVYFTGNNPRHLLLEALARGIVDIKALYAEVLAKATAAMKPAAT